MSDSGSSAANSITQVSGRGVAVRGDDIDTDRVIPARFLRCVTFDGLGEHAFDDDRRAANGAHAFDQPAAQGAEILIVNSNFGCGSSREHAPQSLMRWGIKGIVGESFAEIFFGNCVAIGIPCLVLRPTDIDALQSRVESEPDSIVALDLLSRRVTVGDDSYLAEIADGACNSFVDGTWDGTGQLLQNPAEIDAVRRKLPYVVGFASNSR